MHLRTYWRIEAKRPDEPHWDALVATDEGITDEARARELARQARENGAGQEIRLVRVEEYVESDT